MKTLTLLLTALTLTFVMPAFANHVGGNHSSHGAVEQKVKGDIAVQSGDVHVSVNGLVCDICDRALEKVFGKQEAVSGIDVDLDEKVITISFKEGQALDDETIIQLITDSGYNVEDIHHVQ